MSVRPASDADREGLHELYGAFFAEIETPAYWGATLAAELAEADEMADDGLAFLAEEDGTLVGFVLARMRGGTRGLLSDLYVRPQSRRHGHARQLARAATDALRARGATHVTLSVHVGNAAARAAYERWGFRARTMTLVAPADELGRRLSDTEHHPAPPCND